MAAISSVPRVYFDWANFFDDIVSVKKLIYLRSSIKIQAYCLQIFTRWQPSDSPPLSTPMAAVEVNAVKLGDLSSRLRSTYK